MKLRLDRRQWAFIAVFTAALVTAVVLSYNDARLDQYAGVPIGVPQNCAKPTMAFSTASGSLIAQAFGCEGQALQRRPAIQPRISGWSRRDVISGRANDEINAFAEQVRGTFGRAFSAPDEAKRVSEGNGLAYAWTSMAHERVGFYYFAGAFQGLAKALDVAPFGATWFSTLLCIAGVILGLGLKTAVDALSTIAKRLFDAPAQ